MSSGSSTLCDVALRTDEAASTGIDRLHQFFERTADQEPDAVALVCGDQQLSYRQLDERANQLARHLLATGLKSGSMVGILVPRSVQMYVSLLGVQKAGAGYVPIDPSAPPDRVAFIAADAGLDLLLTTTALGEVADTHSTPVVYVDTLEAELARHSPERLGVLVPGDPTCYICYTSGSSGRPKGVEIAQSSICNFITVVPEIYGVRSHDRVYQGMTISFDFSVEEIWPTWAVGATLVAGPTDGRRVGPALADFLQESGITMLYCVPTVLATLDRTIESIRTVNVGGEACPAELVQRWGPGRRILNTYGPTEATVTCIWSELEVDKPVTIGRPLPTYTADLLDDHLRSVPPGQVGEICVGGPGVARGYVNLPEKTAERFVPDPQRPGARIYRTGDLGRYLPNGEIEYLGRADAEVKVRGHRVDLQEVESVLMEDGRVFAAVVALLDIPGSGGELAAYVVCTASDSAANGLRSDLHELLRCRLPSYMVPVYLEEIADVPMLPSGKVDRKRLPEPRSPRLVGGQGERIAPATATEERIARLWEDTLRLEEGTVSVTADVFTDLGAHSLIAATIVSRLRSAQADADVSILDVYTRPTIRAFAEHVDTLAAQQPDVTESEDVERASVPPPWWRVAAFGLGQLGWLYALLVYFLLPTSIVYAVNEGNPSWAVVGQLAVSIVPTFLLGRWVLPVALVRLLSHHLAPGTYPLWGRTHLRVWAIQRLVGISPLTTLAGSPWASAYLRLAGAKVGDGCYVGSGEVPLPRFVTLGDDATIGYATHLRAVEIADGTLTIGHVDIGTGAVVAANCVVQGPSRVGDRAVLHEQSLLEAGAEVPDGQRWVGSPAQPRQGTSDFVMDLMVECPLAPREWPRPLLGWFATGVIILELLPLMALAPLVALVWAVLLTWGEGAALLATAVSGPLFVLTACTLILYLRRFALPATPVGVHHLRSQLGLDKWFGDKSLELSLQLTNSLYATVYTPFWLRALGAQVGRGAEVSTIANIDPDLLVLGDECFVADMASVGSAVYANGHVAFRATEVGSRAFVGNAAFIPAGSQLGAGSLIGVCSTPPPSGVDPGASWLGSPPFFLPRRDVYEGFTESQTFRPTRRQVLGRYLLEFLRIALPASILALSTFATLFALARVASAAPGWLVVVTAPILALAASLAAVLIVAAIKWTVIGRYRPRVDPLWSGFVRRTEFVTGIYEATAVPVLLNFLTGTPMLGPLLRLFGARVGRRTLIGTTYLTEFDLVQIDDDATVGTAVSLQTHLFEDRVMKMSRIRLRTGVSIGTRAIVLYDTDIGAHARLAPLSLVMKGESLMPGTSWHGIPAQAVPRRGSMAAAPEPSQGALA